MDESRGNGTHVIQGSGQLPDMRRLPTGSIIAVQKLRRGESVWRFAGNLVEEVPLLKTPPIEGDYMVFLKFGKMRFMAKEEETMYCMARNLQHARKKFHKHLVHKQVMDTIQEAVNSEEE